MEKVLLLGASGFIGGNLSRHLVKNGLTVVGLSRKSPEFSINNSLFYPVLGYREDSTFIYESMKGCDYVIDLAQTPTPNSLSKSAYTPTLSHVQHLVLSLEAAVNLGVKKYIYLSSGGSVYGSLPKNLERFDEKSTLSPVSQYGLSKALAELVCNYAHRTNPKLTVICIRPSNPYGPLFPLSKSQGFINTVVRNILHNKPIELWGDPTKIFKDFIFIDDLADAIHRSLYYSGEHNVFNIGRGVSHSLQDVLNICTTYLGQEFTLVKKEVNSSDVRNSKINIDLACSEINWLPLTSLEQGIAKTIEWQQKIIE